MFNSCGLLVWAVLVRVAVLAAGEPEAAPTKQMDPVLRAKALMAVLGIALIGLALVAFVWLAGHYVRRIARSRPRPPRSSEDDWFRTTLSPPDSASGGVSKRS